MENETKKTQGEQGLSSGYGTTVRWNVLYERMTLHCVRWHHLGEMKRHLRWLCGTTEYDDDFNRI